MGRIWRALKLGMKSLLLHKLRSGLTVLGIVFGVAAVISMLAIAEGSSRDAQERIQRPGGDQHHRPLGQAQRRGPGHRRPALAHPQLRAEVRRLRADHGDRAHDQEGAADPRDPQADPAATSITSTAASWARPRTTPSSTCWRSTAAGSSPPPTTRSTRTTPCWPRDDRQDALPLRGPDRPVGQARLRLLHGRRRHQGAAELGRHRRQPGRPGLQQGRLHPAEHLQGPIRREDRQQPVGLDGGRGDAALADHAPGRRRSTRSAPRSRSSRPPTSPATPRRTSR